MSLGGRLKLSSSLEAKVSETNFPIPLVPRMRGLDIGLAKRNSFTLYLGYGEGRKRSNVDKENFGCKVNQGNNIMTPETPVPIAMALRV